MAYYKFEAWRVSGDGNAVFPDEIIIDDEEEVVIHRKPKLIGNNIRQRSLAKPRRAMQQSMIQRLATIFCSLDKHSKILHHLLLTAKVIKLQRSQSVLKILFLLLALLSYVKILHNTNTIIIAICIQSYE